MGKKHNFDHQNTQFLMRFQRPQAPAEEGQERRREGRVFGSEIKIGEFLILG